jgi:hypothetical protein
MNEWWWNVMHSNAWEWGPLSSVYQATFVNDGTYTPVFTLRPNPNSSIVASASAILQARGYPGSIDGITVRRDPGASIEMVLPIKNGADAQSVTDINILTPSIKAKYRGNYTGALATKYGLGRSVKFYFEVTNYLQNYSTQFYTPLTPTGFPQGEAAGAYIEASIIWAASNDTTVSAHSIEATTYASVSARGSKITARQTVTSTGNALTSGTVKFAIYTASGHVVKSWTKKNVLMLPHQTRRYSYTYGRRLGARTYKAVAAFSYGYPIKSVRASTQTLLTRGYSAITR